MKIVVICHYFYPEIGAPSARLFEMAKYWVREGHEVQVVTCFPNHPTGIVPDKYKGKRSEVEEIEGVTIIRNYVYATPNEGFYKKTLGHLSFMFSSILFGFWKVKKPDIILVSSPTFFSVFSGLFYSVFKRKPFVFEVRDLWPDAVVKLGALKNKLIISCLERMELFLYRRSKRVVTVTKSFKEQLIERGIPENKIEVITNGVDLPQFEALHPEAVQSLREAYQWGEKKILLYVGAHGISQGLSTIIEVADQLRHRHDLYFVFVGEGAEKRKLEELVLEKQLGNVQFIHEQPKEKIALFYQAAYLSFVPLRNLPLFSAYIPSKMFEIMGSGCPIVASLAGEAARILEDSKGAIVVQAENVEAIAEAVLRIADDRPFRDELGNLGKLFVGRNYSRDALAGKYSRLLQSITTR
ncbi:glycosyltransferase family 4 protein [Cohnella boryungensis]|uniref:Glycosyltransferase family 4 protein n=1 Tax=Cohnella boryungensis TaxID=768479 RepID=A0ABV8S9H2_9BACL